VADAVPTFRAIRRGSDRSSTPLSAIPGILCPVPCVTPRRELSGRDIVEHISSRHQVWIERHQVWIDLLGLVMAAVAATSLVLIVYAV
jgi:hypothetical protein